MNSKMKFYHSPPPQKVTALATEYSTTFSIEAQDITFWQAYATLLLQISSHKTIVQLNTKICLWRDNVSVSQLIRKSCVLVFNVINATISVPADVNKCSICSREHMNETA
jgi:hypothetical protein